MYRPAPHRKPTYGLPAATPVLTEMSTPALLDRLKEAALDGEASQAQEIATCLVKERGEKPSLEMYRALILSNTSHDAGSAWRVAELLDDLHEDGFDPDSAICHAALKALAVHPDHLLRADVLERMHARWFAVSTEGAQDIVAGLLREGLLEQATSRLDKMRQEGVAIPAWLLDMTVYCLVDVDEIAAAYRIMQYRFDSGEPNISRELWAHLLDKASQCRQHAATSLVWSSQVAQRYLNPSSGICLNVLSTAAQAGDAVLATDVCARLSKRGTKFQPIHFELLTNTYMAMDPPDWKRALSILTIMPLEKIEPSALETRSLFAYLRGHLSDLREALNTLRELHGQGRKIPIAALNLLIECHVHNQDLPAALSIYKQIHTFVPLADGAGKSFANIETFNHLFRGCRTAGGGAQPEQASFLISELHQLGIRPTVLTYDRLMLVFVQAAQKKSRQSSDGKRREILDWAARYFEEMKSRDMMPRFGTIQLLAIQLAREADKRCWSVMQESQDRAAQIEGWKENANRLWANVEREWAKFNGLERPERHLSGATDTTVAEGDTNALSSVEV